MGFARTLFIIGALVMGATIAYGLIWGSLFEEAKQLLPLPWFHVSMIDLYCGFALFAGWIWCREESILRRVIWIVLLLTLGNLASFIYAAIAIAQARGNWTIFWMGKAAASSPVASST